MKLPLSALPVLLVCVLTGCGGDDKESQSTETKPVSFANEVKPILQTQCVRCHHEGAIMGGLDLTSRKTAFKGSTKGPVIVPGDPEKSLLYRVTQLPEDKDHAMPATGAKLTDSEKETLFRWIKEGASWPEGPEGILEPIEIESGKV